MRALRLGVLLGLLTVAGACGGDDGASTAGGTATEPAAAVASTSPAATATTTVTTATTTPPDDGTSAPTAPATAPATTTTAVTAPATTPATSGSTETTAAPSTIDVRVYFSRAELLAIAHREVAGPAVLRGAITELLAGPTAAESGTGLITAIPSGTELLGVNLRDGLATVDLGDEFDDGGGSLSMLTRVGQVVFTATQFDNVDAVEFWIEGAPIEYLGGEGLVMSEPWRRMDVGRDISGAVMFDTPTYGTTVTSPFTVTGEGDVYEGDFPIEVYRDDELVTTIAPVRAGAWGDWANFTVTIDLDLDPGPIEVVGYDAGGCGDDPECPPIVRTSLLLDLG
jgi:germination protein M